MQHFTKHSRSNGVCKNHDQDWESNRDLRSSMILLDGIGWQKCDVAHAFSKENCAALCLETIGCGYFAHDDTTFCCFIFEATLCEVTNEHVWNSTTYEIYYKNMEGK